MKEGRKQFRTSVSGFNKKDVENYINSLAGRLDEAEDRCLRADEARRAEAEALKGRISEAQRDRDGARKESERLIEAAGMLTAELSALRASLTAEKEASEALKEKIYEYERILPGLRQKAANYDRQMLKISQVMVGVRQEAEAIIEKAEKRARELKAAAKDEVRALEEQLEALCLAYADVAASFGEDFAAVKGAIDRLGAYIDATNEKLSEIKAALSPDSYTAVLPGEDKAAAPVEACDEV